MGSAAADLGARTSPFEPSSIISAFPSSRPAGQTICTPEADAKHSGVKGRRNGAPVPLEEDPNEATTVVERMT